MLENLILLRLLAAHSLEDGETLAGIAADLRPLAPDVNANAAQWKQTIAEAAERLTQMGQIAAAGRRGKRLRLTESGQQHVRGAFGVTENASPPAGKKPRKRSPGWAWWRDRFALPKALDADGASSADELRVALLRKLFLPDLRLRGANSSLRGVVDQLLANKLKTPRAKVSDFRGAALRAWLAESAAANGSANAPAPAPGVALASPAAPPEDLPRFAQITLDAARRCRSGRFGEHKVFIHSVWRQLQSDGAALPGVAPGDIAAFKAALTQANNRGLLNLSRADLVGMHDQVDIAEAETRYLHEIFHFIRLD